MPRKSFFDNVHRDAKVALSKVFDKVEEMGKVSILSLKINSLKTQVSKLKKEIGDHVFIHRKDFENTDELKDLILNIEKLKDKIELKRKQLSELKEKENKEKGNPTS